MTVLLLTAYSLLELRGSKETTPLGLGDPTSRSLKNAC
jgi:hypothetical protein